MNTVIATGHMMRCISIADAARELGEETVFILADNNAVELLENKKYSYIVMNTKWNDMQSELSVLKSIILERKISCLLIDSYQVTVDYLQTLKEITKIYYIDDLNSFIYPVDGIICYANYYKKFDYPKHYSGCKLCLGVEYVPLRKEFANCEKKVIKDQVENLLLLSGGSDNYHFLLRLTSKIDASKYKRIDVICGKYNVDYEQLCVECSMHPNIYIQRNTTEIKKYMEQADLIISAGGTTLYEACAVGTPTLSYSMVDNQLDNVRQFSEDGIMDYAGDIRYENVIENMNALLENYHYNKSLRMKKSIRMQKLIDGNGALRVAKMLIEEY